MLKKYFSPIILSAFMLLLVSCSSDDTQSTSDTDKPAVADDQTTAVAANPEITLPTWKAKDLAGSFRDSEEWIGKQPVVINFWGTWCPPCRREIPDLVKLYAEFKPKGVEVISVAVRDAPESVRTFSKQWNMGWVMLMTNQVVQDEMQLGRGVPMTVFLDKNGNEVARFTGAQSYATFRQAFESII